MPGSFEQTATPGETQVHFRVYILRVLINVRARVYLATNTNERAFKKKKKNTHHTHIADRLIIIIIPEGRYYCTRVFFGCCARFTYSARVLCYHYVVRSCVLVAVENKITPE